MTTPPQRVAKIRELWEAGHSTRNIARLARTSQSTASRYIRQFEKEGQAAEPPGREAPPAAGGPGVTLICTRCWLRYRAPAERMADLFCPQCMK